METVQAIIDGHGGIEELKENYIRIENETYMPLVIEWVGSGPYQTELVSVASLFSHPIVYNLRQRCGIKGVAEAEADLLTPG